MDCSDAGRRHFRPGRLTRRGTQEKTRANGPDLRDILGIEILILSKPLGGSADPELVAAETARSRFSHSNAGCSKRSGKITYYNFGTYSRRITTGSDEAQLWFDRGLVWLYAYNHDAAIACFRNVLKADPACAMAH